MNKKVINVKHNNQRVTLLAISVALFVLVYALASRALYTGSWQEYILALGLLIVAITKFVKVFQKNNG